ncbi:hypothetical protein D515_04703 [Grimontia indica]|uniref:Uncharacterized protein n=1 Tax=Grimontia indica TaxID=1056512 RepID=R1INY0_9GAMM|nr:hypothetical protein D515_04703 [Grimontia indica]
MSFIVLIFFLGDDVAYRLTQDCQPIIKSGRFNKVYKGYR